MFCKLKHTFISPNTELPGPPTNLAISNIGPRSVTLQFKPGYDGKTSISRWQVQAQVSHWIHEGEVLAFLIWSLNEPLFCMNLSQVGMIGENEDWVMVHQLANEPDARSLEVSGLNPYTFYRWCIHLFITNIYIY